MNGQVARSLVLTLILSGAVLLTACSSNDSSLVTVAGSVVNIDLGTPAEGVVVFLLDHANEYVSAVTGPDGLFTIKVPKGSAFELVTNDWAGLDSETPPARASVADHWLTFINVDPALPEVNDDMTVVIHACPTAESPYTWDGGRPGLGSAAVWQNFLDNSTTAADYTDATDMSGKIVAYLNSGTPGNMDIGVHVSATTGIALDIEEQAFGRFGYWAVFSVFSTDVPGFEGIPVHAASAGPDIFVEGGTANGPGTPVAIAFGNTGYAGSTITLTMVDTDGGRNIDLSAVSPVVVPVRDGSTTIVAHGIVDNVVAPLTEGICAAGRPIAVCQ